MLIKAKNNFNKTSKQICPFKLINFYLFYFGNVFNERKKAETGRFEFKNIMSVKS